MDKMLEIIPQVFVLLIPLVAIVGGITAGIVKSNGRRRLIELAQRERIAAIERGIDPDKLPPIRDLARDFAGEKDRTFEQSQLCRSQSLTIWGLALTGFGLALWIGIGLAAGGFHEGAPVLMFVGVGIALLIGGHLVRPDKEDLRRGGPPASPRL